MPTQTTPLLKRDWLAMVSPSKSASVAPTATTNDTTDIEQSDDSYLWLVETTTTAGDDSNNTSSPWNARVFGSAKEKDRFLAMHTGEFTVRKVFRDNNADGSQNNSTLLTEQDEQLIRRFELFRKVIEHEDDLLNQRMSWIILAQSFLMAAFLESSHSSNVSEALLYVTATVGLLTVLVTLPALLAAGKNIEVQQDVYFGGLASDEICRRLHGHDRDRKYTSNLDSQQQQQQQQHLLPNMAFRSRFGVPILATVVMLSIVQVVGWCGLLTALAVVEEEE